MENIPVLAFAAWSGTGKTTLMERVVSCLSEKGLSVAVIKHDAHRFDIDREGKDSWRYTHAGAVYSVIASEEKTAAVIMRKFSLRELIESIKDVDLILVEGFKNENLPQIGIAREATGKGFTAPLERYEAIVTDIEGIEFDRPVFGLNDIEEISEFIMQNMDDFTHFNEEGRAKMVDVGEKPPTQRSATAGASVLVSPETFVLIKSGGMKKGDVLTVAQIAGIMGAKRTPELIPMCHPVGINGVDMKLSLNEERHSVEIRATVKCDGKTGVEMEALTAASVAALTVYDMCKAVQKDIMITDVCLLEKSGGIHGDFHREEIK